MSSEENERVWSENYERLLRAWQAQVLHTSRKHRIEAHRFKRRYTILGILSGSLSAFVSVVGVATFRSCDSSSKMCEANQWVRLGDTLISGVVAVLVFCVTFLNYDSLSQKHHETSKKYQALCSTIQTYLTIPSQRGNPIEVLNSVREQYRDIGIQAPLLPTVLHDELDYRVGQNSSDENVAIDVDLDNETVDTDSRLKVQREFHRNLNREDESGLLAQLRYQLERFDTHTST